MKNWKTSLSGLFVGSIPIIQALLTAYQNGQFSGKDASGIAMGAGIIIFGFIAKDFDKSGTPQSDATVKQ